MKWVVISGAVALGMAAMVATMVLAPQSTLAAPARALAACLVSPTGNPTVIVDGSETAQFAVGQTITIEGNNYPCGVPLSVVVNAGGAQGSTGAVPTLTLPGGNFKVRYTIPQGNIPVNVAPPLAYPLSVQVDNVYATPLASITLRSCLEGPTNTTSTILPAVCGPQTLTQDGKNYSTVQSLEQDAEQQIADLRGVANDTTNVYFSRGEIRADMMVNLLAKITACGPNNQGCSPGDQAIVSYYANLVQQERENVALLADRLFEFPGKFCIPGTSSCNWQSWKSTQCGFLVPVGIGALNGPNPSDSAQQIYQNGSEASACSVGGIAGQPSFAEFTSWAAAAMVTAQFQQWATRLAAVDPADYPTTASALNEAQQEYIAALDGYKEGATYLTVKDGQSQLLGNTAGQSPAAQTIAETFQNLLVGLGPDLAREVGEELVIKVIESVLPEVALDLGIEAVASADSLVPIILLAAIGVGYGISVAINDDQLSCELSSAYNASLNDNLYNDITGNASYNYNPGENDCPSGSVTIPQDQGIALLFGALMNSTMPDFTNLRSQLPTPQHGPAQPSDPVFNRLYEAAGTATIANQRDIVVQDWDGVSNDVSIANGWFVVNGTYQPDLEYVAGGDPYRAWIDGNQFLIFRVGVPLGPVTVTETVDDQCAAPQGQGIPTTTGPGLCVVPQGQVSVDPLKTLAFTTTLAINPGYQVAIGRMTGDQSGFPIPFEETNVRTVVDFTKIETPLFLEQGIKLDSPVLPDDKDTNYSAAYLLSEPASGCFSGGHTGPSECANQPDLLYDDPAAGLTTSNAQLHHVGAADDSFTVDQGGNVSGGVLGNDAPTTQDENWLLGLDVPNNVQVSVVRGVSNGTLNLTASNPPFAANGDFAYNTNGFAANSGGRICQQFPIPGTASQGWTVCGGPSADATGTCLPWATSWTQNNSSPPINVCGGPAADSFVYQLCYTPPVFLGSVPQTACSYARASITGLTQTLTISPPAGKITYGDPPFSLPPAHSNTNGFPTFTIGSGSVGCSVDQYGTVTITGPAVGSNFCIIVVSLPGFGGYMPAPPVTIEFHIAGQLLVTASHADVPYGDPAPAASTYSFSYSGFAPPDTQASIVGNNTPACSTNYQPGDGVGAYAITCTLGSLSASTYTFESGYSGSFTFTSTRGTKLSSTAVQIGTFKVVTAPLAVTASHTDLTYSDPAPATTSYAFSYSGFKGQDTQTSIVGTLAPSCSTTYQQGNNAGSYPINCTINTLSATNYTFVSGYLATNGSPLSSSAVQLGAFTVNPVPLSVTAAHADLTFGDPIPSGYTFSYSGFKLSDTQTSVVGGNAPSCGTDYVVSPEGGVGGAGNYGIVCALGSLSSPNYTFVSGYSTTNGTALVPDPPGPPVLLGRFNVNPAVLTVTPPTPPSVQYSDPLPSLTPKVTGFVLNEDASIFSTQPICTPGPVTASFSNAAGTVTTTTGVNAPANTYTITCSGAVLYGFIAKNYTITYKTATLTVTQENAVVDLTGSQPAVALPTTGGAATNQLMATVWDSAATGYTGANAESAATGTIGDVTKMFVEFDIYPAGSCLVGTPAFAPVVPVSATTTAGVGTASYNFTQSMPGAFCVVPRVVGATAGSTNGFYTAPDGPVNGIAFYVPSGAFVTGGGWVPDAGSSNGHGNFGFEAHYNNAKPHGTFVYVWRGTYNGQSADFIIKSNAVTSLTIVKLGPNSYQATLQGKSSYTIVSAATGQQLYGEGNDTFIVTVTDGDNGLPQPQASNDNFTLITFQSGNVQLHPIATISLSKGDVVVHN